MQDLNCVRMFASRRKTTRVEYRALFELRFDDQILRVDAVNISSAGVSGVIRGIAPLSVRKPVRVYLHNYRPIAGVVRWMRGREVGVSFTEDLANHPRIRALVSRMENGEPAVPEVSI